MIVLVTTLCQTWSFLWYIQIKGNLPGEYGNTIRSRGTDIADQFNEEQSQIEHIPLQSFEGSFPLTRMLYTYTGLSERVQTNISNIKRSSSDLMPMYELFAYYTWSTPTPEILYVLRDEIRSSQPTEGSNLNLLYKEVQQVYMRDNLVLVQNDLALGLWVPYPQHWYRAVDNSGKTIYTSDGITYIILPKDSKCEPTSCLQSYLDILDFDTHISQIHDSTITECIQNRIWCGSLVPVRIGQRHFMIIATASKPSEVNSTKREHIHNNLYDFSKRIFTY